MGGDARHPSWPGLRGIGAWLSFRSETVPGTAPIALKAARLVPDATAETAAAISNPHPSTRAYGLHRGVPGLTLCLRCRPGCPSPTAQCLTGQPPRQSRPPASHRRGRSPSRCPRATAPMGRRWDARGTSRGGPEGRGSEHANLARSPGRAGFDIVPAMHSRLFTTPRTMSNRATLAAKRSGAPLHATRQAAGVPSAGSQPFNHPPRDRDDGATLGCRRQTRRPVPRDAMGRGTTPAPRSGPPPLGHATPSVARLMGRRDARPHTPDQKAGAPGRKRTYCSMTSSPPIYGRRTSGMTTDPSERW